MNHNSDPRYHQMQAWLSSTLTDPSLVISPLAGDASFRRYFRVNTAEKTYVLMDAPPQKESCQAFIAIAAAFQNTSVRLPILYASNMTDGFLLLSDFGDQQLLPLLQNGQANDLYTQAMDLLLPLQQQQISHYDLPSFDAELFQKEFEIFFEWYVQKNLQKELSVSEKKQLDGVYQLLIHNALSQPTVFVHRDYHSRNIMLCDDGQLGILDFQDAVRGPLTYDLVSLLRDCYIDWNMDHTRARVNYFFEKWCAQSKTNITFATFMRWFDWMGLQRHLKCLGIFSRLYYRDQKAGYLKDIPRVLNYALSVCDQYSELTILKKFLI